MKQLLALAISLTLWFSGTLAVEAAEVLQVRSATLLQVGDGNRNYSVELACIRVEPAQEAEALRWLRSELPRRSRVNLRPMGQDNGVLVALVQKLGSEKDLTSGLVSEGLAQPSCSSPSSGIG